MSLARARVAQSLRNGLRQSHARPAVKGNTFRRAQIEAKRYASSGGEHARSSDLPWLVGAIAVTVPSCYYLWPTTYPDDGHHDSHGKHEEKHEEKEEEAEEKKEESSDDKPEEKEAKSEKKQESKSDGDDEEKSEGDDEEKSSKPAKKTGESNVEGVKGKGKLKAGSDGDEQSVKIESDSKGANKKRLDSGLQKNLGPASGEGDSTSTDSKQDGLSNTQSRHSIPIDKQDDKSKKADGTPETSKTIGTVDAK